MTPKPSLALPLTKHAEARCHQRGIKHEVVQFVLQNFDQDHHAGAGASAISISKARAQVLSRESTSPALLERAARTVLVVSEDGYIITAINRPTWHNRNWARSRRCQSRKSRRDRRTRAYR